MFSNPEKNIEQFGLRLGQKIADLGSGSGHYALAAAKAVGEKGRVYAIDIQDEMLSRLKSEAKSRGLLNLQIVHGDIEKPGGTHLKDESVDGVVLTNIMFQVKDKKTALMEACRILKPGGRLLFVEWVESFGGIGPHPDEVFPHNKAIQLCYEAGFSIAQDIAAGEHHYGIIFNKR